MYAENVPKKKRSTFWLLVVVVLVIVTIIIGAFAYRYIQSPANPSSSPSPSTTSSPTESPKTSPTQSPSSSPPVITMTIYGGEVNSTTLGYGTSPNNIQSPGPNLSLKLGQIYSITLVNVDSDMYHNWVIVDALSLNANVLFNSQIGSAGVPVAPGKNQSATFTPTQSGNLYYICQVQGHFAKGMWGQLIVTP
jgi:hypothetical protein